MNRELKFRIWDKANKEYKILGATGLDARNGDVIDYYNEGNRLGGPEEYDVEQYTGLKDRNDKEIYEGDIVDIELHFRTGNECIKGTVGFDYGCFSVKTIMDGHIHPLHIFTSNTRASVIGNVHENKDLLDGSN